MSRDAKYTGPKSLFFSPATHMNLLCSCTNKTRRHADAPMRGPERHHPAIDEEDLLPTIHSTQVCRCHSIVRIAINLCDWPIKCSYFIIVTRASRKPVCNYVFLSWAVATTAVTATGAMVLSKLCLHLQQPLRWQAEQLDRMQAATRANMRLPIEREWAPG